MTLPSPNPYIITKPGGLTTGEHLGHIVAVLFTCGLWLPGYIYFAYKAPRARYDVAIPYGADPVAVAAMYAQVAAMNAQPPPPVDTRTAGQRKAENRQAARTAVMVIVAVVAVVGLAVLLGQLMKP